VDLGANPLSAASCNDYIPQLQARGVSVEYDVIQVEQREGGLPTWVWIVEGVLAALLVLLVAIIYRVKFKQPAVQVSKRKK